MWRQFSTYFDAQERRLVFQSIVVGAVVWAVVYALKTAVHELGHASLHYLETIGPLYWTILAVFGLLFIGALIVAGIARYASTVVHYRDDEGHIHELIDVEGDGLERAISLYYTSEPTFEQSILGDEGVDVRWKMPTFSLAIRKFVATLATLGSGGSGGLEASVTLIGESLSAGLFKPRQTFDGRLDRFWSWWGSSDPDHLQTAQLSGIAAAVATLLGAPFTAAFFATEVMYRRRPIIEKLVYSLISALVAFFLNTIANSLISGSSLAHFETSTLFKVEEIVLPPLGNWRYYALLVIMSVAIAIVSIWFARLRAWVDHWFHHNQPNVWVRHLTGAAITGAIAIGVLIFIRVAGSYGWFGFDSHTADHALSLVLGTGESVINDALAGKVILAIAIIALVAKMFATLATIGSGGSAGLLVPSLFFGTMIATIVAQIPVMLGYPEWSFSPLTLIAPAMTASLVAIVNVPLAAILFVVESFSGGYMVPAIIALLISNILAFNGGIYRTQREKYSERQILPGYGVRRLAVPLKWDARTMAELNLRSRFDVNVIGWVENESDDGLPHVRLSADAHRPLNAGDTLVVLGTDAALTVFAEALSDETEVEPAVTSSLINAGVAPTSPPQETGAKENTETEKEEETEPTDSPLSDEETAVTEPINSTDIETTTDDSPDTAENTKHDRK